MDEYPLSKTIPWKHQVVAWNKAKNFPAFYYAHGMGAGKSKAAIDYVNGVHAQTVLILCPKKVIDVWPRQFELHSGRDCRVLPVKKGTATQKAREISQHLEDCQRLKMPAVIVCNYDMFWRPPLGPTYNEKNRIISDGLLKSISWDVLIADEGHRVKSPNGRASWGIARIAKSAKRRLFLSGTPLPHSPLDIYAQFRALDPTVFGTSFALFKRRYCILGGFENKQVVAFVNQDDLQNRFYSRAHRVTIEEAVDLPEKTDITIECDLDPSTMKVYKELENEFIAMVGNGIITVNNALDKLLRLSQITSGTLPIVTTDGQKEIRTIDNNKLDTVIELIEDLPAEENVVVFCRFREELRRLTDLINNNFAHTRRVGEISGRIKPPSDFVGGYWKATDTNTLLVQIQAGGEGIDLSAARYCIYLSMGYSLGQYDQSRSRIHRPGQTRKVFYYHVLARKTVDKKIMKAIAKKQEIVDYVLKKIVK